MPSDPAWQAAVREGAEPIFTICSDANADPSRAAEAVIRTALATLERHGYVLVPKEATPDMGFAGCQAVQGVAAPRSPFACCVSYDAMLAARPSIVPVAQEG